MEAIEYQVGSYVYSITCAKEKLVDRITSVIATKKGCIIESGLGWYEQVPIRLTQKWLRDFGFNKLKIIGFVIEGATYWEKYGIVFYEIKEKYYLPIGEKVSKKLGRRAIQFDKVHDLQDIFALTGKKLVRKK